MVKKAYTPEQLNGKFIVYSRILDQKNSPLAPITHVSGEFIGLPYLFNSIAHASFDKYFDPIWDEIVPASEYFEMMASKESQINIT